MKKTIFVTGGAGFVGANLVRRLVKENYEVHIAVRPEGNLWRIEDLLNKVTLHTGILQNPDKLKKTLQNISPYAIFHLATYGAYPTQKDTDLLVGTNVRMTMNLLESLKDIPYTHFAAAGSSSEYGKKDKPMKETDILEPNNYYGALKASQTYLCQVYSKMYNKPSVLLRLFNVYGPFEEKGRLVHNVIQSVFEKKPILLATGKEARDLIYMDDVVDAFMTVLKRRQFYGEVFNIGTGVQTTIAGLADAVKSLTKSEVPVKLNHYEGRQWDSYRWVASMKKTNTLLRWKAKYPLKKGLQKTIAWYKTVYEK
jgi:nucleoside-diphosphate-sugar epimerase